MNTVGTCGDRAIVRGSGTGGPVAGQAKAGGEKGEHGTKAKDGKIPWAAGSMALRRVTALPP